MMGIITDSCALAVGGLLGSALGAHLPRRVRDNLPLIFGVITIALGTTMMRSEVRLPIVVLSLICGAFLGELRTLENRLENQIRRILLLFQSLRNSDRNLAPHLVTLISVFCFGSMGLIGAMTEGLTGSPGILVVKAVLDLFTALIFGSTLGIVTAFIALPQFAIFFLMYCIAVPASLVMDSAVITDFSACGGIIFLATGIRMCGIKVLPVINMLPGLPLIILFAWLNDLAAGFPG